MTSGHKRPFLAPCTRAWHPFSSKERKFWNNFRLLRNRTRKMMRIEPNLLCKLYRSRGKSRESSKIRYESAFFRDCKRPKTPSFCCQLSERLKSLQKEDSKLTSLSDSCHSFSFLRTLDFGIDSPNQLKKKTGESRPRSIFGGTFHFLSDLVVPFKRRIYTE